MKDMEKTYCETLPFSSLEQSTYLMAAYRNKSQLLPGDLLKMGFVCIYFIEWSMYLVLVERNRGHVLSVT